MVARRRPERQDVVLVPDDRHGIIGDLALDGTALVAAHLREGRRQGFFEGGSRLRVLEDAARLLELKNARNGLIEGLVRDFGVGLKGIDEIDEQLLVIRGAQRNRHERNVDARLKGALGGIDITEVVHNCAHVEGVGDGDARKAHLATQDVGHEDVGERGGKLNCRAILNRNRGLRLDLGGTGYGRS